MHDDVCGSLGIVVCGRFFYFMKTSNNELSVYIRIYLFNKEEVWNIWIDSNKFQHEVEIIVIEKSNIYDWIMVEIFELRVLANI